MSAVRIERLGRLDDAAASRVRRLVDQVADADGVAPLGEHVLLHLAAGGDEPAQNFLAWSGDELVGYAHLDPSDVVAGPSAELAVHPAHRRQGVGRQLLDALDAPRLRLWSHGELDAATHLAERLGFRRSRVLWQMRRSLYAPLPPADLPDDITLRAFRPGRDEAEWVALNARAFAELPDQGSWTEAELLAREGEPWFDAAGFLVAERAGRMVGFHWTKVHGATHAHADSDGSASAHAHAAIGEVYVVGVDPDEQGRRLGRGLTLAGLHHLRGRGLGSAMLYVDESNPAATRLYTALGFSRWDSDVLYRRG